MQENSTSRIFSFPLSSYIDWFDKQCQVNDASGFSTHVFSQYRDVIEHKHDRILFVDNKNPDDAVDEEEEAYKIQNKVQKLVNHFHQCLQHFP